MIYFDYAATTPVSKEAIETYGRVSREYFYNSESLHQGGDIIKDIHQNCEKALNQYFTDNFTLVAATSGSHANQMAIDNFVAMSDGRIMVSPFEHPSVFAALERHDKEIVLVPLNQDGTVDVPAYEVMLNDVDFVIQQHVNSETGQIFPVEMMSKMADELDVYFHCDCVQSAGKIAVDTTHFSSYSISGHKIFGPKGIGALMIRPALIHPVNPYYHHEYGLRNGTIDIAQLVAMTESLLRYNNEDIAQKRARIVEGLNLEKYTPIIYEQQSPYIIPLYVNRYEGQYIMQRLSQHGILISTGTACGHGSLHSIGLERTFEHLDASIHQYIRISICSLTTEEQIDKLLHILNSI